jgi:hypothetical protein
LPTLSEVAEAVKDFGGEPQAAQGLASVLGFEPITSPVDLLSGPATPLQRFLESRFGVRELYRTGGIQTDNGTAGLYIAVLNDWGTRSVDRDRSRRRVARALVELERDARSIFVMVPNALQTRLGHASIQTTLDIYSHVAPGLQEAAAVRFDGIFTKKTKNEPVENVG